jgi:ABC-type amino acid transport substrate-binding protein
LIFFLAALCALASPIAAAGPPAAGPPVAGAPAADVSAPLPVLTMGFNEWPPYLYPPEHGKEATGLVRDVLDICVPAAGYRMRYQRSNVPEIFASLESGAFDLHVLSFKEDRARFLDYGAQPLFQAAYRPFVVDGSPIEIKQLSDFDGLRLGHKREMRYTDAFYAYLEGRRAQGTLTELAHEDDVLRALLGGQIDIAVMMLSTGMRRAAVLGLDRQIEVLDYDIKTASYPVAVSKASHRIADREDFLAKIDECINAMMDDGRMDAIFDRYADFME